MVRKGRRRARLLQWETDRFERSAGIESGGWLWLSEGTIPEGDIAKGNPFGTAPVRVTRWWLRFLPRRLEDFTFIDLGSGRGRVLFGVASSGFRRVVGVEFVEELHRDALANVERYGAPNGSGEIEPVLGDAASYEFPLEPLVVHFCNPFSEAIMEPVIANLVASYEQHPRPIFALYHQSWIEPDDRRTRNVELL